MTHKILSEKERFITVFFLKFIVNDIRNRKAKGVIQNGESRDTNTAQKTKKVSSTDPIK
jgi:hypothetical protein